MTQPADTATARDRLTWLDYAKAIGIILVVFAHASRSIGRTSGLHWSDNLQWLDGVIYAFHMPLFFLIAGYAAQIQRAQEPSSFLKSLLWGVAVPYAVWSTIWIGLKILLPEAANVPLGISALGNILWQPVEHFWFLYHLFFIRLGWFGAKRLSGSGDVKLLVLLIFSAAALTIVLTWRPELDWVAGFLKNFAIYGIGLVWLPMLLRVWNQGLSVRLAALGAALCMWGYAIGGAAGALWPAIGGAFIVVALAKSLPQPTSWAFRIFAYLGEASLAIYVMHLLVGAVVRAGLAKTGLISETVLLIGSTTAGLILPAFAYWLVLSAAQRTTPALPRVLGLGPATRSAYLPLWLAAANTRPLSSS